jgi:uncharacterized protein YdeI (YjbR/CyaY-like superfamily)
MPTLDSRVDHYIQNADPYAQPILRAIRTAMHAACPEVIEGIKWRNPHFDYKGIFCGMAAFKKYCSLGFWKEGPLKERLSAADRGALEQLGRLSSIADLPPQRTIARIIKAGAALNDQNIKLPRRPPASRPPLRMPADFKVALAKHRKAGTAFAAFSPSQRRDYIEWITDAKGADTRARRLATAIEWIAEGKGRNWKYERRG